MNQQNRSKNLQEVKEKQKCQRGHCIMAFGTLVLRVSDFSSCWLFKSIIYQHMVRLHYIRIKSSLVLDTWNTCIQQCISRFSLGRTTSLILIIKCSCSLHEIGCFLKLRSNRCEKNIGIHQ